MHMQRKQYGFTLIELMVVVAVIGILSLIAVNQFNTYSARAASHACLEEAKAYMQSAVAEMANNRPPAAFTTGSSCSAISGGNGVNSSPAVADYMANTTIVFQPSWPGNANTRCFSGSAACELAP